MDCKIASDLMMKYFDGEITKNEEVLLNRHLDECSNCKIEYEALDETLNNIDDIEMEEAPEWIEKKVIANIINENKATAIKKGWITALIVFALILFCGLCTAYLITSTPIITIAITNINLFIDITKDIILFAGKVIHYYIFTAVKILMLERALSVIISTIMNVFNIAIELVVFLMITIVVIYGYLFKTTGR